jgi:ATP-dependent DNA helicase RecQ
MEKTVGGCPSSDPLEWLRTRFGYPEYRPYQREIIDCLLQGRDAFALMPTGSGKSLCYQVPSVLRKGVGIVVSPLIALMQDQVAALKAKGVRAEFVNSSLSYGQIGRICLRVVDGEVDILYVAPERLLADGFQNFLQKANPCLFAIDEAHCVSQWGHDFRPEYLRIREITGKFPGVPRIALTATADAITRREIVAKLELQGCDTFIASFDRPNIYYRVGPRDDEKDQLYRFITRTHEGDSGIVYVRTRQRTETIAAWLRSKGIDALPYHAGMSPEERARNQNAFFDNSAQVIVATIAFGMGIDKADVRFVCHLNLPQSMEAYYQETGRAGRDGKPADAWMIYSLADVIATRRLLESSVADEAYRAVLTKKLENLLVFCETAECRRKFILNYFDEPHGGACACCDNCKDDIATRDATAEVRLALQVARATRQRFGTRHLIDVLTGKSSPKVEKFQHDQLDVFGCGRKTPAGEWESIFRQLIGTGVFTTEMSRISGLKISPEGWQVLRGQRKVFLRQVNVRAGASEPRRTTARRGARKSKGDDPAPVQRLKRARMIIARHLKRAAFTVLHDQTLQDIAAAAPANSMELKRIRGIGETKAAQFGSCFIHALGHEDFADEDILALLELKAPVVPPLPESPPPPPPAAKPRFQAPTPQSKAGTAAPRAGGEAPVSGNWEPDAKTKEHILNQIRKLKTVSAVNALYANASRIAAYARKTAAEMLGSSEPPPGGPARGGVTTGDRDPVRPAAVVQADRPEPQAMTTPVRTSVKTPPGEAARACPSCGSPMVLREARNGPHAGKKFWGCSQYPKCRGVVAHR